MLIRETADADVSEVARLLCEADDARVVSPPGILYMRGTRPVRARMLDLVAEVDGAVVARVRERLVGVPPGEDDVVDIDPMSIASMSRAQRSALLANALAQHPHLIQLVPAHARGLVE